MFSGTYMYICIFQDFARHGIILEITNNSGPIQGDQKKDRCTQVINCPTDWPTRVAVEESVM